MAVSSGEDGMKEPIRVAQILNKMDSGGIEAVVMNYYRNIERSKIQFDFYFSEDSLFPQREELEKLGAGIYTLPPYSHVVKYHKVLYKSFKKNKYKIVHAQLSTMSIFALFAAWRAGVPTRICHNHSTAHLGEGKKTIIKYILRPLNKIFATDYWACGEKAGRWMYGNRSYNQGKVFVLPNAIDTERYIYTECGRRKIRQELGIPERAFVMGTVGRFMYQKNQEFLVRIYGEVKRKYSKAYLVLVGEGEMLDEIKELVARLQLQDGVIFTGARKDVNELYSAMDVFCLTSRYEGMPLVAWEAQANGLKCFLSQNITREADCTKKSLYIPITEMRKWVSAIEDMIKADDEALRDENRKQKVYGVPDIHEYAEKLQGFYEKRGNE